MTTTSNRDSHFFLAGFNCHMHRTDANIVWKEALATAPSACPETHGLVVACEAVIAEWSRQKGLFAVLSRDGWMDDRVAELRLAIQTAPAKSAPTDGQPARVDAQTEPSRHSAPGFSVDATAMLDQIKKLAEELIKLSAKAQVASPETPAAPAEPAVVKRRMLRSKAERDVIDERRRQVSAEGCSTKLDDVYQGSELALAAAWYATPPFTRFALDANDMSLWPISWLPTSFKPGNRRRELVKSGALIIAELERLDREAAQAKEGGAA